MTEKLFYSVYNKLTKNLTTWKEYEVKIQLNNHNFLEIPLNLTDVTLLGTSNSVNDIDEIINRFQIRLDLDEVEKDAYEMN